MSKKLLGIRRENDKSEGGHEKILMRILYENTNLINECKALRKEKHSM